MINKKSFAFLLFLIVTIFSNGEPLLSDQINYSDNNTESVSTPGLSGKFSINLTDRVERIFSYRLPDGTLRFTNSFNDIPREYAGAIESVSEFPIMCMEYMFRDGKLIMTLNDGGRKVAIAGVLFKGNASKTRAENYLNENMANKKLRVRYNPQEESGLYLNGLFYQRGGTFINLDMVKKGIGEADPDSIPSHLMESFFNGKSGEITGSDIADKLSDVIPEVEATEHLSEISESVKKYDLKKEEGEDDSEKNVLLKEMLKEEKPVVDVENVKIKPLTSGNALEIFFNLVNKTNDNSPVTGFVFVCAASQADKQNVYALWPQTENVAGVPEDYTQGDNFSIRYFVKKQAQILRHAGGEKFDHFEILIYSEDGDMILKKEFGIGNE